MSSRGGVTEYERRKWDKFFVPCVRGLHMSAAGLQVSVLNNTYTFECARWFKFGVYRDTRRYHIWIRSPYHVRKLEAKADCLREGSTSHKMSVGLIQERFESIQCDSVRLS